MQAEQVEQVDREAAADLIESYWRMGADVEPQMKKLAESIRAGHSHGPFPAAFARFRQQVIADTRQELARIVEDQPIAPVAKQRMIAELCALEATRASDQQECPRCGSRYWLHDHECCNAGYRASEREVQVMREALEWYGEQARLARLIHSEGDKGRHALADDGGKRARAAIPNLAQPEAQEK